MGPKEDPHKMGLVLEWVYGTIVSTAEKARDGAKRALGERCVLHVQWPQAGKLVLIQ